MTYKPIGDSRDRDAWLKLRRSGIGGSDAPAILGLVPWASPTSVQADKWGLLDEPDEAEQLRWGRRLESAILEGLAEDLGEPVHADGRLLRSDAHPFMICTPDGRTESGVWVQAKNTVKAEDWSEEPPPHVYVQCQHEMAVTGDDEMIAVALILGSRLRWARVHRDEAFIGQLVETEREFWRLACAREPFPGDGSEHARKALGKLYPDDTGEVVVLPGEFTDLDRERLEILATKKQAEARLAEIETEFRRAMKDAPEAILQNGVHYTLKTQHVKTHERKATSFRVLRRKEAR